MKWKDRTRCGWADGSDIYRAYHDREWGEPVHDDRRLFEFMILEGAQAGLSWATILKKREGYRKAFAGFEIERVAAFTEADVNHLLADPGIVRNRKKIESTISNARGVLGIRREFGSLDRFLWQFVGGTPKQNAWRELGAVPTETAESRAMSKALQVWGLRYVGPTICYAFMQAVGMVNDHVIGCFRHRELST